MLVVGRLKKKGGRMKGICIECTLRIVMDGTFTSGIVPFALMLAAGILDKQQRWWVVLS